VLQAAKHISGSFLHQSSDGFRFPETNNIFYVSFISSEITVNSVYRASLQDKLVVAKCKVLLFLKCEKKIIRRK